MPYEPRPRPRPTKSVLDEQKQTAERRAAAAKAATTPSQAPAKPVAMEVAPTDKPAALPAQMPPDTRTSVQRYLDEVAPATLIGRRISGSKEHVFVTPDDGEPVPDDVDFVAPCDRVLVGHIHFNGEGVPPDYRMGELYAGFVPTRTEDLPDRDQSTWQLGLDGQPSDPWPHFMYLPLQRGDTGEWFTYATSSKTGRRAVGTLLKHFDRLRKSHPDMYPIVRLKTGGFNHRDPRVGWVPVPVFAVVGRHPADDVSKPDSSPDADMDDSIPF
jgi:hypothetical protein